MNTQADLIEEQIDLLVDGELPQESRATLFGAVESAPGGWRRCALAYVEAQTLGESLADSRPVNNGARWWKAGGIAAALAAAFLGGRMVDGAAGVAPQAGADRPALAAGWPAPSVRPALFEPMANEDGAPTYSTHEQLPDFLLMALLEAGHRVRQVERTVQLDRPEGEPLQLPLLETHIVDMRPRAL